jgi:[ribosomal protein S5]-alanine N-acetyltransferase
VGKRYSSPRLSKIEDMLPHSPRLDFIPATAELIRLEINAPQTLGQRFKASIPSGWPPQSVRDALEFFAAQRDAAPADNVWGIYYWIANDVNDRGLDDISGAARTLVGSGGFTGSPDANGVVEIGYGTLDIFQNRGYATEAARALAQFALSHSEVTLVIADALPENAGSVRVLQKSDFVEVGVGAEAGTVRFAYTPATTI